MADRFASTVDTVSAQARRHFAIVPSDVADLPDMPKAIYCQVAGTLVVRDADGVDLPYAMTAGQILPFRGTRIMSTGTAGTYYGWI